jgi:hypothetical protein
MKSYFLIWFLFSIANLYAQDKGNTKKPSLIKFNSIVQAGLLEGESKNAFQAQAINGVQYRTWYGGVGVGVDNYKFRTIPLFIDIQKNIFKRPTTPFVFTDAGIHFPWVRNDQKNIYVDSHFRNGFYFNLGAGYKINLFKNNALVFSTAFSLKHINELQKNYLFCDWMPCPEQDYTQKYKYTLRRLALNVGWFF